VTTPTVATLTADLTAARAALVLLAATAEAGDASDRLNYGDDPAMASGIRRKPNSRAETRRHNAYSRTAASWAAVQGAERRIAALEHTIERTIRDLPIPYTPAELKAARLVRDRFGWHAVVTVNAKSISVKTPWSWTERIMLGDVIEVRG
jgi:hypothetical protein